MVWSECDEREEIRKEKAVLPPGRRGALTARAAPFEKGNVTCSSSCPQRPPEYPLLSEESDSTRNLVRHNDQCRKFRGVDTGSCDIFHSNRVCLHEYGVWEYNSKLDFLSSCLSPSIVMSGNTAEQHLQILYWKISLAVSLAAAYVFQKQYRVHQPIVLCGHRDAHMTSIWALRRCCRLYVTQFCSTAVKQLLFAKSKPIA
jgi:hypothetical protein